MILGGCYSIFKLTKQVFNCSIILRCTLQENKWGLSSGDSLQELQVIQESENLEVLFLKYRLFLKNLTINCFK